MHRDFLISLGMAHFIVVTQEENPFPFFRNQNPVVYFFLKEKGNFPISSNRSKQKLLQKRF